MRIVLLGPPGAGKGSLAMLYKERLGVPHLSTGQLFREEIARTPEREGLISNHPCLKPQQWMRIIVRALLPLGEGTVLDPFMGSGATVAAAEAVGYNSIGVEADSEYFQLAEKAIPLLAALYPDFKGEHLEPAGHRREERALAQLAGVVDAAVAGRVDLDDVDRALATPRELAAAVALAARVGDRRLGAVERARQDASAGGLAAAAWSGEQVGVVDPVAGQRSAQRLGDMLLPDDLGEGLRAVAAVERERRHAYEVIGGHRQPGGSHGPAPGGTTRAPTRKDPSRTCQSRPTLAAFRPWGSSVR